MIEEHSFIVTQRFGIPFFCWLTHNRRNLFWAFVSNDRNENTVMLFCMFTRQWCKKQILQTPSTTPATPAPPQFQQSQYFFTVSCLNTAGNLIGTAAVGNFDFTWKFIHLSIVSGSIFSITEASIHDPKDQVRVAERLFFPKSHLGGFLQLIFCQQLWPDYEFGPIDRWRHPAVHIYSCRIR